VHRVCHRPLHRWFMKRRVRLGAAIGVAVLSMAIPPLGGSLAAPAWTLTGKVVTASGVPLAHAVVGLSVVPNHRLNAPTATNYLTGALTAADGSFVIPAPALDAATLAQAVANDGWLNIELDAAGNTGTMVGTTAGSGDYRGSSVLSVLVAPTHLASAQIGTVRGAPNAGLMTAYEVAPLVKSTPTNPCSYVWVNAICSSGGPLAGSQIDSQCGYTWDTVSEQTDWEPVGELHAWDDQTAWFSYGQTASTQFGVSFNYGQGWQVQGNIYIGNSTSSFSRSPFLGPYWGHRVNGQFAWAEDYSDNGCHSPAYRIRAEYWTGGFDASNTADVSGNDGSNGYYSAPQQDRADFSPGVTFDRDSGQGYHYGFEASAFGVTVGSETDYSTDVHMHWQMGNNNYYHSLFAFGTPPTNSTLVFSW